MTRRLLLVRHGQIVGSGHGRFIGATDPPLDSYGQQQAKALAGRLARLAPQRCYCSPKLRCRQTASAAMPEMTAQLDEQLREIDFGQWENRTFAEIARDQPLLVDRWASFAADFAFPGGESLQGFMDRVRAAADRLVQDDAETVLAVTHGGVIRAMLCHLLGLEPQKYLIFDVPYAAMAVVDLFDGRGVLMALERAEALEAAHG